MSITLTGNQLIAQACYTLQLISPEQSVTSVESSVAQFLLQELIDSWNLEDLTILTTSRHVFNLVANQGGPDNPYTLGPGGDFDTLTAARPVEILQANLVLQTVTPSVEIPLSIYTDDTWQSSAIKDLTNPQPTSLYFNPTSPLAQIILWPIPNTSQNTLALYYGDLTPAFTANLSAPYICPPGYAKAFRLNLALAMCPFFFINADRVAMIEKKAIEALDSVKASNLKIADLTVDPAYTSNVHSTYNLITDEGG